MSNFSVQHDIYTDSIGTQDNLSVLNNIILCRAFIIIIKLTGFVINHK